MQSFTETIHISRETGYGVRRFEAEATTFGQQLFRISEIRNRQDMTQEVTLKEFRAIIDFLEEVWGMYAEDYVNDLEKEAESDLEVN